VGKYEEVRANVKKESRRESTWHERLLNLQERNIKRGTVKRNQRKKQKGRTNLIKERQKGWVEERAIHGMMSLDKIRRKERVSPTINQGFFREERSYKNRPDGGTEIGRNSTSRRRRYVIDAKIFSRERTKRRVDLAPGGTKARHTDTMGRKARRVLRRGGGRLISSVKIVIGPRQNEGRSREKARLIATPPPKNLAVRVARRLFDGTREEQRRSQAAHTKKEDIGRTLRVRGSLDLVLTRNGKNSGGKESELTVRASSS